MLNERTCGMFNVSVMLFLGIFLSVKAMALTGSEVEVIGAKARKAYTHYECMAYAKQSTYEPNKDFIEGHYKSGLKLSTEWIEFIRDDSNTEDIRKKVLEKSCFICKFYLGGPSVDFAAGRFLEGVTNSAYDKIIEEAEKEYGEENGFELRGAAATKLYKNSNCEMLL